MPQAKKGETCLGKRGLRGEKREGVGSEESFEESSESWLKAGHIKHGNRLGWAGSDWQQATRWSGSGLATSDSS